MKIPQRGNRSRPPRGGLLLEALLAMGLMVMIGLLALGVARDASRSTERADRRAAAVELAASRIAELEAGLVDLDAVGDLQELETEDPGDMDSPRWRFVVEVETSVSAFEGMVRVEVVVREDEDGDGGTGELARLVTLIEEDVRAGSVR